MISPRSLRGKLTALVFAVSFLVLGVGSILMAYERRAALERELIATAEAVASATGEYLVSTLAFDDRDDATSALARLGALRDVDAAALYDAKGELFATYYRGGAAGPRAPVPVPERFSPTGGAHRALLDDRVEISLPIAYEGKRYGTIHVRASAAGLAAQLREMYVTLAAGLGGLLLLSVVVGWVLQRIVTRPIARLAAVAAKVAAGEESRVGATHMADDELGALGRSVDTMLDRLSANARSLRDSHQTIEALIDAAPLAIIGLRADGTVATWNPQATRIFGVEGDEALGRRMVDVVPAKVHAAIAGRGEGVPVVDAEVDLEHDGGRRAHLVISCAPLAGGVGAPGGALVIVSDVTERRLAERALVEREQQLQRAQQLELVGRLSGGLAHDFNNLLTVILTSASLIERRGEQDPLIRDLARSVVESAERGSLLTRRLLGFSKQPVHEVVSVDLNQAIAGLTRMITSAIGEQLELKVELAATPVCAEVDPSQLEQVLLNLVINARDAMPHAGTLRIVTRRADPGASPQGPRGTSDHPWAVAEVVDTGVGMTAEVLKRATEAFYTTKRHGTGLGLSTSAALARSFGGELVLTSAPGVGTNAALWLPLAASPRASSAVAAAPVDSHGREVVLLVEDEPAIRTSLRHILEDAGYTVLDADGGAQALERHRAGPPIDVLVTDVVMRGMTGPELVTELTRQVPGLPVLYISGYLGEALTGHGLGEETMLLQKPFAPDVFLKRLRELLDGRILATAGARGRS